MGSSLPGTGTSWVYMPGFWMKKIAGEGIEHCSLNRRTARHALSWCWTCTAQALEGEDRQERSHLGWEHSGGDRFLPTARWTRGFTHTSISLILDPVSDLAWIKKKENPWEAHTLTNVSLGQGKAFLFSVCRAPSIQSSSKTPSGGATEWAQGTGIA